MSLPLEEKVVIITGGSLGVGEAAARALRAKGATVAITGRSDSAQRVANEIGATAFFADYKNLADVKKLARDLLSRYPRIDVLVNNVGAVMSGRSMTVDGHESTLQVNHLGGFLLTSLLTERLVASGGAVVNTSSGAHRIGHIDLDDFENEHRFSPMRAYGTAKLMNILHVKELHRRHGGAIRAAAFHPGVVATGFAREGTKMVRVLYETALKHLFMISPERGADTLVWLASTTPGVDWRSGEYYMKRKVAGTSAQARDSDLARAVWDASERLVGVTE